VETVNYNQFFILKRGIAPWMDVADF